MAPRICFVEQDPGMLASRRTLANPVVKHTASLFSLFVQENWQFLIFLQWLS